MVANVALSIAGPLILAAVLATGCASRTEIPFSSEPLPASTTAPATDASPRNSPAVPGVVFQVGDLVIVTFSDTLEPLQPHEERIKEDGCITLPLIGSVKALGKTPGELQKEIQDKYVPKFYRRLTVTVKYQAQELSYSVLGEVRMPGPKPYLGVTTVTKAIGAAGGLTDYASKRNIWLTRANGTKLKVNYRKAIANPALDPQVFPGDSINVEKSIW
ncbi:MAG: polysaccharide biosynthesis/export family protein [Verrucomicrobiales bacterium]|nr:polysaccharide biosynthesis/export family protein [Verrucomicrobiales bacterium]